MATKSASLLRLLHLPILLPLPAMTPEDQLAFLTVSENTRSSLGNMLKCASYHLLNVGNRRAAVDLEFAMEQTSPRGCLPWLGVPLGLSKDRLEMHDFSIPEEVVPKRRFLKIQAKKVIASVSHVAIRIHAPD